MNSVKYEITRLFGAGRVTPEPDGWSFIDTPETCRIYYVHSGNAYFFRGGERIPLTAGHMYFIPPRLPFAAEQDISSPMDHTFFDFSMRPQVVSKEIIALDGESYPELGLLVRAAERMTGRDIPYGTSEYTPLIGCIETIVNVISGLNELKTVDDPTILSALDIIENGYMNGITVTDVALRLGYDTDHFIKKFRKAMGTTPYAYIKALKLHEAEMLRRNGFTMAQAAERTGYSTPESLYHAAHRKKIDKVKKLS